MFCSLKDIMAFNQEKVCGPLPYPIIADDKRELAVLLGMLDPDERDKDGMPLTARCVSFHNNNAILKLKRVCRSTCYKGYSKVMIFA